jgi:hypothetical protein
MSSTPVTPVPSELQTVETEAKKIVGEVEAEVVKVAEEVKAEVVKVVGEVKAEAETEAKKLL